MPCGLVHDLTRHGVLAGGKDQWGKARKLDRAQLIRLEDELLLGAQAAMAALRCIEWYF